MELGSCSHRQLESLPISLSTYLWSCVSALRSASFNHSIHTVVNHPIVLWWLSFRDTLHADNRGKVVHRVGHQRVQSLIFVVVKINNVEFFESTTAQARETLHIYSHTRQTTFVLGTAADAWKKVFKCLTHHNKQACAPKRKRIGGGPNWQKGFRG